jgi:hypothetical protein
VDAVAIHGSKDQAERDEAIRDFKNGVKDNFELYEILLPDEDSKIF